MRSARTGGVPGRHASDDLVGRPGAFGPARRPRRRATVRDGDRLRIEGEAAADDGGEVHELADHPLHLVGGDVDLVGEALGALAAEVAGLEDRREALDRRERGAQLVADVGEELGLHALQLPFATDVAEHEHGPGHVVVGSPKRTGRHHDGHLAAGAPAPRCPASVQASSTAPAEALGELGAVVGRRRRTTSVTGRPRASRGRQVAELLGRRVEVGDAAVGVDRDQRLAHAGDHRLEAAAQLGLLDGRRAQVGGHRADRAGHRVEGRPERCRARRRCGRRR